MYKGKEGKLKEGRRRAKVGPSLMCHPWDAGSTNNETRDDNGPTDWTSIKKSALGLGGSAMEVTLNRKGTDRSI